MIWKLYLNPLSCEMVGRNLPSWACHGGGLFNVPTILIAYFLLSAIDGTCHAQFLYYVIQMPEY